VKCVIILLIYTAAQVFQYKITYFKYLPQFSKHCVLRRISRHIVVTFSMLFLIMEKRDYACE